MLLSLEVLLAIGAYAGAVGLITGGISLGEAPSDLPFGSAVFGGWMLGLVNGVLPTVVVAGALAHRRWATRGHLLVGAALVGWIVVQVGYLGLPPHPLQVLYFAWGWAIVILALRLHGIVGDAELDACAHEEPGADVDGEPAILVDAVGARVRRRASDL